MDWRIKAGVQKALSSLPGGYWLNGRLQRTAGGLRNQEKDLKGKLEDFATTSLLLQDAKMDIVGARIVEIGTGWYPALPLCFYLSGAESIRSYDLTRHLSKSLLLRSIETLEDHLELLAGVAGCPREDIQYRYKLIRDCRSVETVFQVANISYCAPADAANTGVPDASIDLVYSNSVLEHVSREALPRLFGEAWRVLRPWRGNV